MMPRPVEAVIVERYITPEGQIFQVVASDEISGTIEIQYDDGAIEELDFEDWHGLQPRSIDTSEDWENSDYGDSDDDDSF